MMTNVDRIVTDPEVMLGKPVFKDTRLPVYIILDLIADDVSRDEIIKAYPNLTNTDIDAALTFTDARMEKGIGKSNGQQSTFNSQ